MTSPSTPETSPAHHPKYRPDIDGLRAIAVLSVVGFHAFPKWVRGGFIGVDIFFVISGFLISTIIFENLARHRFSFLDFYSRRIKRIFPALLLVLIAAFAFGWFMLLADEYKQLGEHIAAGAGFVANLLLWRESGYFDIPDELKPMLHLWSLGIEEQFYIVWPIFLWFAWKQKFNLFRVTIAIAFVSFALNVWGVQADGVATFYSPQTRFWELLIGSLLAYAALFRPDLAKAFNAGDSSANLRSIGGGALLAIGILVITKERAFPGWWALLPTLGAALIISAGPKAWLNRVLLSNPLMVWFGLISFPLYLWHWPLLTFARLFENGDSRATRITMVLSAIALAWLTYRLVERPIRFGTRGRAVTASLALMLLLTGGAGVVLAQADGFSFRFTKAQNDMLRHAEFNWDTFIRLETCHLQSPNSLEHRDFCIEKQRPRVALWGDSHGASLYPGLKKLQETRAFGVIQLTQAGCGPIFGLEKLNYKKNCNEINERVFGILEREEPEVIVLHAAWLNEEYPLTHDEFIDKLTKTLKRIKTSLPASRIVVVGPVPRWKKSPQVDAYRQWEKSSQGGAAAPDTAARQAAERDTDLDAMVERVARDTHVEFASALSVLCNDDGCLARVGKGPTDWTGIDSAHLSKAGAEYLAGKLSATLLP